MVQSIDSKRLNEQIQKGEHLQILDVRPYPEFVASHMEQAINLPIGDLKKNLGQIQKDRPVYLVCKKGVMAGQAARRLEKWGIENTCVLKEGLDGWQAAGLPVKKTSTKLWSLERQVRLTASSVILLSLGLAAWAHPAWIGLAVFICAGLIFSAVTDTCGMALLIAKLPWNQKPKS